LRLRLADERSTVVDEVKLLRR
jgi:hypothetical protein